ncbi:MAG: SGNH/GDSL hydrolase family protein [Clostridia bacterium]|nr:SGNH/GDSL hydrolase family protein [Clostridia bacterium]
MKLKLEQIEKITAGAIRVEEICGKINFFRFTKEEEELYKTTNADFVMKSLASSGVKLNFKTDSRKMFLKAFLTSGSSRKYFSFDLFVNGEFKDSLSNFSDADLSENYTVSAFDLGYFEKTFDLGEGEKKVTLYFPWSVKSEIEEISLDDNSVVIPIKNDKKILMYGDSITQGYDALHPSNKYATRLSKALGYDEYNKGIGAEVFFPPLSKLTQPFTPDLITVAYGTNDWSYIDKSTFDKNCKEFYENLSENYPRTPIVAITPIWRKEIITETRPFGDFKLVEEGIREAVKDLKNVTVIRGFDFVPKEEKYFADLRLHPNDEGFEHYFKSIKEKI